MQEVTPAAVRSNLDLLCMSERRGVELANHVRDISRRSLFLIVSTKILLLSTTLVLEGDDF